MVYLIPLMYVNVLYLHKNLLNVEFQPLREAKLYFPDSVFFFFSFNENAKENWGWG